MNNSIINYMLSMTIVLAGAIAGLKWNNINKKDKPIVIGWWIVILTETIKFILSANGNKTLAPYNIYPLPLIGVFIWQFLSWGTISVSWAKGLFIILFFIWVADMFVVNGPSINQFRNIFKLAMAVVIVILSVSTINQLIMSEKKKLITNHRFLICLGMTIYYTFSVFVNVFFLSKMSKEFLTGIANFNRYLLQVYYFLLFLAALWIPRKKNFILQF